MKIDPKLFNTDIPLKKTGAAAEKNPPKRTVSSEYNVTRGFLILSSEQKEACDSKKTYYINRDGSGRVVTAWGSEEYPAESFSDVLEKAKEISTKNDSVLFSQDEIESLLNVTEEKIEEQKNKK